MKFEDCNFYGKNKVKYTVIHAILEVLEHNLMLGSFAYTCIWRYLEILIDDQEYNVKTGVFYDEITNRKLNYKFLAGVAKEYILEHADEFKVK